MEAKVFKWIKSYNFRMFVQAEVKAQTNDQDMTYRLCNSVEAIATVTDLYAFLRTQQGYTTRGGAFMALFPVYALGLQSDDFSLSEKNHIATWLNNADARAKRDIRFYTTYAHIFLAAQSVMHEFCLKNDIDPYTAGLE